MRNVSYRNFSEAQQKALLQGVATFGEAHRYHVMLATQSGEPAGSGVCITSAGQRGILTARHVLYATDGEGKLRLPNPVVAFAPPRGEMLQEQRRRQHERPGGTEPFGPFPIIGIPVGDRLTGLPLQRQDKVSPDPGLPDIAVVALSDDIEERLRDAANAERTAAPEPKWVDLDRADLVGVPYGFADEDDKMLEGCWLITGVRGERSDVKKFYSEMDGIVIDRIYRRSECEYYGVFVDEVGGRRDQTRSWKGTSGGGIWQQGLRESGWRKIEQSSSPALTPEDLESPVLAGVAFFHETRKLPQELRGDLDGARRYRGELYAHRIDRILLSVIRSTLRHGVDGDG